MKLRLWMVAAALLLVAVAFSAWQQRSGLEAPPVQPIVLAVAADCDSARAACLAQGEGLEVELWLGPPVVSLTPFDIALRRVDGVLGESAVVEVQFVMPGMDMGINRYRLARVANGLWQGRAILPVCTSSRVDGIAALDIRDGPHRWTAALPFTSD